MRVLKWDITNECNINCKHCYNNEYRKENSLNINSQ